MKIIAAFALIIISSGCTGSNKYIDSPGAAIVTKYVEIDGKRYLAQQLPLGVQVRGQWMTYANRWVIVAGPIEK